MATCIYDIPNASTVAAVACVNVGPVLLRKGQSLDWFNPGDFNVEVRFTTSPFNQNNFKVPARQHVNSGPVQGKANTCGTTTCPQKPASGHTGNAQYGHYKYSILCPDGTVLADPEVVIKP